MDAATAAPAGDVVRVEPATANQARASSADGVASALNQAAVKVVFFKPHSKCTDVSARRHYHRLLV
jgi:hypothetical protein